MEELEKVIKQANRNVKYKKVKDKLLWPYNKLKVTFKNYKKKIDKLFDELRHRCELKHIKNQEEKEFQDNCSEKYNKFLRLHNSEMQGYSVTEQGQELDTNYLKTFLFTENGPLVHTIETEELNNALPPSKYVTSYEGFIPAINGELYYVYTSKTSQRMCRTYGPYIDTYSAVIRDKKGRFCGYEHFFINENTKKEPKVQFTESKNSAVHIFNKFNGYFDINKSMYRDIQNGEKEL